MDRTIASSLPSHFRYTPPHRPPPSPFFRIDDELPVQSVDSTPPKTRLEVLKGWEVSFTVLCLYTASFLAFVYVILKLRYCQYHWETFHQIPTRFGLEQLLDNLLQAVSFILPLFFALNLYLAPSVTDEQLWTLILLIIGLCATNPLTRSDENSTQAHLIINDAVYTATIYLYLFLAAHSYRVFDVRTIHTTAFYLPKLAAAVLYLLVKLIAGFRFGVSLGLIPYARLLTWLLLQRAGRSSLRVTIPVLLTTLLDTALGFWIVHEVASTSEFLATVPYVENRSKQLGFRCFVYQTLAFCFNMIGLSLLITYMLPREYLYSTFDNPPGNLLQLEPPVGRLGLAFIYVTWTVVLTYVNLPPTPLLPFAQQLITRALYLVRNNRVAVWLGLADIVNTEDAEDSDDATEMMPLSRVNSTTPANIPLRYRHRELFDDVVLSPQQVHPISPLVLSDRCPLSPGRNAPYTDVFDEVSIGRPSNYFGESRVPLLPSSGRGCSGSQPIRIFQGSPQDSSQNVRYHSYSWLSPDSSEAIENVKRLRLRKNLFVMETAVMMVNAAYLSYIPGNPNEERKKLEKKPRNQAPLLHIGSLSSDLDDLARQIEEENEMIAAPFRSKEEAICEHPDHDDGTMFQVNPQEMAERNGYKFYRHMHDEFLNTHAIVLMNASRVIVAFSGTRDVTNWGVNANTKRALLDEKLSRFEYELSNESEGEQSNREANINDTDEPSLENFDFTKLEGNAGRRFGKSNESTPLRRSKSEEKLADDMESGQLNRAVRVGQPTPNRTPYGTLETSPRRGPPMFAEETFGGSRTGQGVTMVASAFAKELLTFGQPKVHEGFIEAYMSLRKHVMGTLIELYRGQEVHDEKSAPSAGIANSLPLFFCGHSLGGALATFASYEAARYFKRIGISRRQDISCTTFGCPRIGNEAFKARYERLVETHWRFEIAADPIPRVPTLLVNYVPVGVQVLIDQSGMLLIDPSFIEVQWWGQLTNLYIGYRLHIRASYCMALRTYCKLYKNGTDDLADKFWPFPIRVQTRGLFRHAQQ